MINKALKVINSFLTEEINLFYKRCEREFPKTEYKRIGKSFVDKYFVSHLDVTIGIKYKYKGDLNLSNFEANIKNHVKRNIFRIERYKMPKMSEAFNYLGEIDEIFVCYVSSNWIKNYTKVQNQFILAKVDNLFKVIAERSLDLHSITKEIKENKAVSYETLKWGSFTTQAEGFRIIDYGKMIEVEDLELPNW